MRKRQCDPLRKFMIKPRSNIIGDKVTKQQRQYLNRHHGINRFGDWDKDGVINGLDCRPRNPRKHSWKQMDPEEQYKLRDQLIEEHFKEKGYYKYGGPDRIQDQDLNKASRVFFSDNPIRKYVGMSQYKKRE